MANCVAQWRAQGLEVDLGALPMSNRRELRSIGPMQALVSLSASILISFPQCFKEHFIIYVFLL
jgi:hypothetical protein